MPNVFRHLIALGSHAELVSASDYVSVVMPNVFQHLETLKQVQGDTGGLSRVAVLFACHAELVSASDCVSVVMPNVFRHLETLKQVQGDGAGERKRPLRRVQGDKNAREWDPKPTSG